MDTINFVELRMMVRNMMIKKKLKRVRGGLSHNGANQPRRIYTPRLHLPSVRYLPPPFASHAR